MNTFIINFFIIVKIRFCSWNTLESTCFQQIFFSILRKGSLCNCVIYDFSVYGGFRRGKSDKDKTPCGVSIDNVTVSPSHFAQRNGLRLPIAITQSSFVKRWWSINDKPLLTVLHIFSSMKSSMYREIFENPVAEGLFPENNLNA